MLNTHSISEHPWWKSAIIYQIYPRSFQDSNGDGIGDIKGILQRIDYISSLGIDAVWLNPVYPSPNDDGGYDISDFTAIHPEFGDMRDLEALITALHARNIRLIMDLVVNHSSDEHPWFVESRKSKDNPFRDYYIWKPGVDGGAPNNWPSFFGGSAWQFEELTGEYYLHLFSKKQPDLNWENKLLRKEITTIMKFWLEKGVDGLRLDVISLISKRPGLPDSNYTDFKKTLQYNFANGPNLHQYIKEMRREVWDAYNPVTIGEGPGITPDDAPKYLDPENGLNLIFHFDHMVLDQGPGGRFDPVPWSFSDFKAIFKKWDDAVPETGGIGIFLGNHDYPRMVSRWGDDQVFRVQSAKMLITLLLTMRGTPFVFQGDEIGMTNLMLESIDESKDIESKTGWEQATNRGIREDKFLTIVNQTGRDNARSPMQWDSSESGGFTSVVPWMKVNPNKVHINVQHEENDPDSILNYFRKMTALRKTASVLAYGSLEIVDTGRNPLFIFHRVLREERWTILLNFSSQPYQIPVELTSLKTWIIGNDEPSGSGMIKPWEAQVYKETD